MIDKNLVPYTEIFRSMQGEGLYTGYPSMWLRFYRCNLECRGFSQPDPADSSTYEPVGNELDLIDVKDITELPVFAYGCDTAYSVSKRYEHLIHQSDHQSVVDELGSHLPVPGVWVNENYEFDMVFTGGEPLLKPNQKHLVKLLDLWNEMPVGKAPQRFTFETNGTQKLTPELIEAFARYDHLEEVLLSYSPKLFHVSGETNKKAIKPDVIVGNVDALDRLQFANHTYTLKFVLSPDPRAWEELEQVVDQIGLDRHHVWIMPVSGTVEGQYVTAADVANMAIARGYKVAARVHTYVFGNALGT